MNITVQAFELSNDKNNITLEMLNSHIQNNPNTNGDNRYIYIDRYDGWWTGLLLTAKNIKAYPRMEKEKGRIKLSPEAINKGELGHFNFFLLHEERRRGLFQYYHGSASIHIFAKILKSHYNYLKNILIEQACKDAGKDPNSPPPEIIKRYAGNLNYSLVLRQTSFEEIVSNLRGISKIDVQFTEYVFNDQVFRPLAEKAKTVRHHLTFKAKHDQSILDKVIELSRYPHLKSLSCVGIEEDNIERKFKLLNEPESLGTFDFNDVVLKTEFDSDNVHNSLENVPFIAELKKIAEADDWMMGRI
ncbi:MAG: hypothetical protein HQK72_07450 [Desulfamplus sp.]|nr:hypothetical protein [Desulfamplus sp.]